jgi:hypothetical protein
MPVLLNNTYHDRDAAMSFTSALEQLGKKLQDEIPVSTLVGMGG